MRTLRPLLVPLALSPLAAGAAAAALFAAGPAAAQEYAPATVEELTIVGNLGPDGRARTLSRVVNIADLDLRYDRDVREMQRRVRTTARQICEELGETGGPGLTPSCVDAAVRGTYRQTRIAIAQARTTPYYAYAVPVAPVAPYAGYYAPPAAAVVPVEPIEPPEL